MIDPMNNDDGKKDNGQTRPNKLIRPSASFGSWQCLDTLWIFYTRDFQFSPDIIITELEDCLINYISKANLYNTMNVRNINIYDKDYIDALNKDMRNSTQKSLVVISNQISTARINVDIIKKKTEAFYRLTKIPVLCFFPVRPNFFMKPHTGTWALLKSYYRKYGGTTIQKAVVVSNEGGLIDEKQSIKHEMNYAITSDIDRAFAANIDIPFMTIDEYLGFKKESLYKWDTKIISPEIRQLYKDASKNIDNPNILDVIKNMKKEESYLIIMMGPPRCGKTTLAKSIISQWNKDKWGDSRAIVRISKDTGGPRRRFKKFQDYIKDRFSVIIDGEYFNDQYRRDLLKFAKEHYVPTLVIDVNVGINMAKVFNHSYVNDSRREDVYLYRLDEYRIYNSLMNRPRESEWVKYIKYTPEIQDKPSVMEYRY